jgi:peptidoglycan hydrolase-like protein with peptidoglycan-binding domain
MRIVTISALASLLLVATALPAATPKVRRGPTAPRASKLKPAPKAKTQSGISPERATQIQTALIREGYLTGAPSGTWDAQSQAAMEKLQADNGWQTKLVPDARALNKLGLGANSVPETVAAKGPAQDHEANSEHETSAPVQANQ